MKTNVLCHTALKPLVICMAILTFNINQAMSQEKITQTAGRTQLGEFAPEFAELNDDILFGQVWNSPGLCPHDRSMVTIATLVGKGIIDSSLTHHLQFAKSNGVTREEISAMLTHIAFYAGWPNAWGAFRLAKDVWAEGTAGDGGKAAFQREMIFPIGEPNTATATSLLFPQGRYRSPMSRSSLDAATTGISTMPPRAAVRCWYA